MPLLMLAGLIITIVVWVNYGVWWGLLAGLFLATVFGWMLLLGLISLMSGNRREKAEFVGAWEARAGEMHFGNAATYPLPGLYEQWLEERETTGESAGTWLDRRFRMGGL